MQTSFLSQQVESKTPQGVEPRPDHQECHHQSLLLFFLLTRVKSKTWRNSLQRVCSPRKRKPPTIWSYLLSVTSGERSLDARLKLEEEHWFPPPVLPRNTALDAHLTIPHLSKLSLLQPCVADNYFLLPHSHKSHSAPKPDSNRSFVLVDEVR